MASSRLKWASLANPDASHERDGAARLGVLHRRRPGAQCASRRQVAAWLLVCCALVFAMVVVGGVTRLTHSGLSITEWQPIVGTVPPLSDAAWQDAFAKYQQTPEFQQVNRHMSLAEFKPIFWMEWAHRLLGRLIGLVFLVPFALLPAATKARLGLRLEARRDLRPGRAAGRHGVVHGARAGSWTIRA